MDVCSPPASHRPIASEAPMQQPPRHNTNSHCRAHLGTWHCSPLRKAGPWIFPGPCDKGTPLSPIYRPGTQRLDHLPELVLSLQSSHPKLLPSPSVHVVPEAAGAPGRTTAMDTERPSAIAAQEPRVPGPAQWFSQASCCFEAHRLPGERGPEAVAGPGQWHCSGHPEARLSYSHQYAT